VARPAHPDWDSMWEAHDLDEDAGLVDVGADHEVARVGGTVWLTGPYPRQAVMGLLVWSWRTVSITTILDGLAQSRVRIDAFQEPHRLVHEILRYQASIGRARRVGRGRYAVGTVAPGTAKMWRRRVRYRSWPWAVWDRRDLLGAQLASYRNAPRDPRWWSGR
jgi:hypothetical protein